MKKIAYILGIICAMTMQSCLDLEPKTQLADTNYWKSPEHFKLFATQFYSWSADFRWLDDSQHADIRSDLFAGSTVNIYSNGTNSIPSSDKHYTDNYNRIRQTNTLLQQADTYEQQADIAISVGKPVSSVLIVTLSCCRLMVILSLPAHRSTSTRLRCRRPVIRVPR